MDATTDQTGIGQEAVSHQQPVNVLVLDDDRNLRDVVEQCLTRVGFNVMTASEGSEGLQVLLSNRFDVVVSDLMMEPMDGITFLTEALKIWPWMGVVVFSGYIQDDLVKQATELGIEVILEKPVSFDELTQHVINQADKMQQRVAGHQAGETLIQVQYQLNILRENTRVAIEAASLEQALSNLSRDLGVAIPSVATAILSQREHDGEAILVATLRREVSHAFLAKLEAMIYEHYHRLSGKKLPQETHLVTSGIDPTNDGISQAGDPFTFPIINKGSITGILCFIPPENYTCSDADISFLYHAANHLTTVLIAFHRIRELAVRDELTKLYNRHHLQDELPTIWQMAVRYGFNIVFIIMDVDHFKLINDNYGHQAGDDVLQALAQITRRVCRSSDLIARHGGDELIIVLPDADPGSVSKLTDRLLKAIRNTTFCPDSHAIHCTVSIGVACSRQEDGSLIGIGELFSRADDSLYAAKRNGRNRSHIWTPPTSQTPTQTDTESPSRSVQSAQAPHVIIVDDDAAVLKIIAILLETQGMVVSTFENDTDAMKEFEQNPHLYSVALIDLNLNDTSGLDLVEQMNDLNGFMVPIIITGDATLDNAINSLRQGAYDFIQKPIQKNQLQLTMNRALEYYRLRRENQDYQQNLEAMVKRKSLELTSALKRTRDSFDFTLRAMTAMLDAREQATGAHSHRVQEITMMLAREFGIKDKDLDDLRQGALLHDIGKIGVPDAILLKPGPLTDEEWVIMRQHVNTGYDLISSNPDLQGAAQIMLTHHEKFDGTGYPNGLKGEEIPLGARIFSVVDAYDAMRSTRNYRVGMPQQDAVDELKRCSGSQFDPSVIDTFIEHLATVEEIGQWES